MLSELEPTFSDAYGDTGLTRGTAYIAGSELVADALRLNPKNIANLKDDQLEVLIGAALTAEEAGGNGAADIIMAVGATRLRSRVDPSDCTL